MMKRFLLVFLVFLAFLFESTFVELVPTERFGVDRVFVPRFMIILLMLISFFYDRNKAVLYAIFFGLLFDIIYTDIIGVYMFSIPIVVYLISFSMKVLHRNLLVILFVVLIGIGLLEGLVYGLYYIVNIAAIDWNQFLYDRLLPTLVLNGVFLIVVFYPVRRFLLNLGKLANNEKDKIA